MIKVAWNYLKGYKKNTIVCVIGIALSVMMIFSLVQMGGTIMAQYQNVLNGVAPYDMRISALDAEELEEIYDEITEGYKSKEIWCSQFVVDKTNTNVNLIGVEGDWEKTWGLNLIEGEAPKGAYELCVDEKFCEEMGKSCGEEIELVLQDQNAEEFPATFQIVGVLKTIPTPFAVYYMFTDTDTAKKVIVREGYVNEQNCNFVNVLFDEKEAEEQMADQMVRLTDKYGTSFVSRIETNEEKEEALQEKGGYYSIAGSLYVIVGVMALCMVIFIYNTISISLTERLRQYGTLRCLGISNKGLLGILFMEELLYTVGGLILGIFAGRVLNGIVAERIIYCLLGILPEKTVEYPWLYLLVIGITLSAVFLASVVTILRISGQMPMGLLKYMEKLPKRVKRGNRKNFFMEMVNRNLQRNPSKNRILFVTISLAAFLIIAIGNMASTLNFSLDKTLFTAADIQIEAELANTEKPYIGEDTRLRCEALEGVEWTAWQVRDSQHQFFCEDREMPVVLYVYSDNWMQKFLEYNGLEKLAIGQEEVAIVLKTENSRQEDWQPGNHIRARRADKTDEFFPNSIQSYDIEIDEVLRDSESDLIGIGGFYNDTDDYIIVNEVLGRKLLGDISYYTNLFLECEKNMDANEVRMGLDEREYVYHDMNNAVQDAEKQLSGIVALCVYLLVAVVLLAIFIIQNIIKANFRARLKEIGMLRSIGAEEKLVKHLLCGEIVINAIKGVVLGGALAGVVSVYFYYMSYGIWGMGVMGYLIGIPVILFGCYLVASFAVKNNLKTSICDLIKCE